MNKHGEEYTLPNIKLNNKQLFFVGYAQVKSSKLSKFKHFCIDSTERRSKSLRKSCSRFLEGLPLECNFTSFQQLFFAVMPNNKLIRRNRNVDDEN